MTRKSTDKYLGIWNLALCEPQLPTRHAHNSRENVASNSYPAPAATTTAIIPNLVIAVVPAIIATRRTAVLRPRRLLVTTTSYC